MANKKKIDWWYFNRNTHPDAIDYLINQPDKIIWKIIWKILVYLHNHIKIDWSYLSKTTIKLLGKS